MKWRGFMGERVGGHRSAKCLRLSSNLGIDDLYFELESVDTIANHIMALYGAKVAPSYSGAHVY